MAEASLPLLHRAFDALEDRYDLLVIGGGIYGAWTAYDAALRGLRVALIEASDWGAGTSSASSKLIHGGLRYLEYGHIGLVRTALAERSRLLRLGPHRVHMLRFLLPVWQDSRTRPWKFSLGLTLYDLLAGLGTSDRHRRMGAALLRQDCPFLEAAGLRAGFSYDDAGEDDARYCLEIVAGAVRAGATAINHCRMLRLLGAARAEGAVLRDEITGDECTVTAASTVLATGPWLRDIARATDLSMPVRLTKGVHLVMPPLPTALREHALLLTARADQRVYFLIPWYGATLLGTTDTDWQGDPAQVSVEPADVEYLLREVASRCPGLGWRRADIRGAFAGLRTLQEEPGKAASAVSREWTLSEPRPGLLVPIGGKLTAARADAAVIVDRVCAALGRHGHGTTATRPLPWAPRLASWLADGVAAGTALGLDRELATTMVRRYGSTLPAVHALLAQDPGLRGRIHPQVPMALGETLHAVRCEMAVTLQDVLRRRVPAGILAVLELPQVRVVTALIGPFLRWDEARCAREAETWWQGQHELLSHLGASGAPATAATGGVV